MKDLIEKFTKITELEYNQNTISEIKVFGYQENSFIEFSIRSSDSKYIRDLWTLVQKKMDETT